MKKDNVIRAENFTFSISPTFLISIYVLNALIYVFLYWSACFFQYSQCKTYEPQTLSNFIYTDPRYAAPTAIFGVLTVICQRGIQIAFEYAVLMGYKKIEMYSSQFDSQALYVTMQTFGWLSLVGTVIFLCASSMSSSLDVLYATFHSGAVILAFFSRSVWNICAYIALHEIFNSMFLFFLWTIMSFLLSLTGGIFMMLHFFDIYAVKTFPGNLYFSYIETAILVADIITTFYVYQVVRYKLNTMRV